MNWRNFKAIFFFIVLLINSITAVDALSRQKKKNSLSETTLCSKLISITNPPINITYTDVAHSTTRPHNRKIVYHPQTDTWYALIATGNLYHSHGSNALFSSEDGINWNLVELLPFGMPNSSGFDILLSGDKIIVLHIPYDWRAWVPPPIGYGEYPTGPGQAVFNYTVREYLIDYSFPLQPIQNAEGGVVESDNWYGGHGYGSICQDTTGYFWVASRYANSTGRYAFVTRSNSPNDISTWGTTIPLSTIHSSPNAALAPDIIALDNGKVFCILYYEDTNLGGIGDVYGVLYNPQTQKWENPYHITEVAGITVNKGRSCSEFDSTSKKIHLIYYDRAGNLIHKIGTDPYNDSSIWSTPVMVRSNVIVTGEQDHSFAIDTSVTPSVLTVVYPVGDYLYRKEYNGTDWLAQEIQVGCSFNYLDEVNLIRDMSHRLGMVYFNPLNQTLNRVQFQELPKIVGNQRPVANILAPQTNLFVGKDLIFDASRSSDMDGLIINYFWDFDYDGIVFNTQSTGMTTKWTYDVPGIHTVGLKVCDNLGVNAINTRTLTVTENTINRNPTSTNTTDNTDTFDTNKKKTSWFQSIGILSMSFLVLCFFTAKRRKSKNK